MADAVVAPAPVAAEVAAPEAAPSGGPHRGDIEVPFVIKQEDGFYDPNDGALLEAIAPEGAVIPPQAEEVKVEPEPVKPDAPVRLKAFRKEDNSLDEERVEAELAQREQAVTNFNAFIDSDPTVKLAVLKALKNRGTALTSEQEAFLTEKDTPPAPAKPKATPEQIQAHYQKLREAAKLSGDWSDVIDFKEEWIDKPRLEEAKNATNAERARIAAENNERNRQAQTAQAAALYETQAKEAETNYKHLVQWDHKAKALIVKSDKMVPPGLAAKYRENADKLGPKATIQDVLEYTLLKMGQFSAPKPKVAAPVPGIRRSAPPAAPPKQKLGKGEMAVDYVVVGQ